MHPSSFSYHHPTYFTSPPLLHLIVRLWLGAFTCIALSIFRRALSRATNAFTGRIFLLICASQFHLIFWASRPLPNLFAFPLVTIALARWIDSGAPQTLRSLSHLERRWSLYESTIWFTIAIAIFRSEILGLAGPLFLSEFIRSPSTLSPILLYGLFTLALSISKIEGQGMKRKIHGVSTNYTLLIISLFLS